MPNRLRQEPEGPIGPLLLRSHDMGVAEVNLGALGQRNMIEGL